jgi:hypothetical protein
MVMTFYLGKGVNHYDEVLDMKNATEVTTMVRVREVEPNRKLFTLDEHPSHLLKGYFGCLFRFLY